MHQYKVIRKKLRTCRVKRVKIHFYSKIKFKQRPKSGQL